MPGRRTARTTALAAVIAATVVSMPSAHAQPAADALKAYNDLTHEAEKLTQDHLKATGDLSKANADLVAATEAEKKALAASEQFRGQVDLLTEASFQGARFNDLSALLTSSSQQDFLQRMQALNMLAADNNAAVARMTATLNAAAKARAIASVVRRRGGQAGQGRVGPQDGDGPAGGDRAGQVQVAVRAAEGRAGDAGRQVPGPGARRARPVPR